ncbi:type IV pilus assembly protein PilE [Collimonas sp. PA-H2]|uniref:type IV pilin protein n=1 Tax=Collimonas sp. PA-H2 TaxID=1881062 RepID=UPI000C00143A|nr:type IV pilin protein [Collimonas sp. PA-H2]PFH08813.1 type IV pilus assembly protein PilE [Collimonas sp. PA-H2]
MKYGNMHKQRGFTLIELMIVVVVIAILARVAVPSYRAYVQRGDRAAAMAALLQDSNWMQQQFTINNSYPIADTSTVKAALPARTSPASGTARYNISISSGTGTSYVLSAAPVSTDKCGTFTLDNTGARGANASTDTTFIGNCWAAR